MQRFVVAPCSQSHEISCQGNDWLAYKADF